MADLLLSSAFWGVCGSFIYGAPRLHTCLTSPKSPPETPLSCIFEFVIALIIGAIGAAAGAPWIAGMRHLSEPRDLNALAVLIGLTANPAAPILISFAPRMASTVLAAMKGPKADEP